jgi:prevent-host-death family protein
MGIDANHWTSAEAKASFSSVIDRADNAPQVIERHGKPAGVVIGWEIYRRHREELEGGMETLLRELADINLREGDMEDPERSDRPLPEGF